LLLSTLKFHNLWKNNIEAIKNAICLHIVPHLQKFEILISQQNGTICYDQNDVKSSAEITNWENFGIIVLTCSMCQ